MKPTDELFYHQPAIFFVLALCCLGSETNHPFLGRLIITSVYLAVLQQYCTHVMLCFELTAQHWRGPLQFYISLFLPEWMLVLAADLPGPTNLLLSGPVLPKGIHTMWCLKYSIPPFQNSWVQCTSPVPQLNSGFTSTGLLCLCLWLPMTCHSCQWGFCIFICQCHHNCHCCIYSHLLYYFFDTFWFCNM